MTTANTFDLLKAKKPREITHPVIVDHDAVEAYAEARRHLAAADEQGDDTTAAQAAADELEPAAEAAIIKVKLRALPGVQYAALKATHPPKDDDHKRMATLTGDPRAKAVWHEKTFTPALVAASLVDPAIDTDQATELRQAWNEAEWDLLVSACRRINERTPDVDSLVFKSGRTRS